MMDSIVSSYGTQSESDTDERALIAGTLTGTNLTLRRGESGSVARAAWQVIELRGASVQRQTVTLGAGQLVADATFDNVSVARSFVLTSVEADNDTDGEDAAYGVRSSLVDESTVQLSRRLAQNPVIVSLQLVELPLGSAVVTHATLATTPPHDALTLEGGDPLDPARSVVFSTSSIDSGEDRDALPWLSLTTEIDAGVVQVRRASAETSALEAETTAITFTP